jgi:outer membrane protein TolC
MLSFKWWLTLALCARATTAAAQTDSAERISFAEAVRRAEVRNPTVAVALLEIDRADALIKQARSGWLPTISGNGSYTRLDSDRLVNGAIVTHKNSLLGTLTVTVPLVAPVAWSNVWHAKDNRRVAEVEATDVRRLIAQQTASAYITIIAQHRLVAAAETARANAKAHYDYAHTRFVGGVGRSLDEVRAQQDLATDEALLQAALTGLARTREALGVLTGAAGPVDAADEAAGSLGGAMPGLDAALDDARHRRTDVRAQEDRVLAAKKQSDDVWVYYAPYLAAVGQPFIQSGSTLQPRDGWQVQLVLALPFYDGGLRGGIARERDALLGEARANLDATLRQAQSEVRVAFEAMLRADAALASSRDAARLAKRAYELADIAYKGGAVDNLQVIDAASRSRDADVAAAQAEDVSRQARLDLLVGSGRFP